jgi:hypothetical protein
MIENLVDKVFVALLQTISGLSVYPGMGDNSPALQAPFCVVWSDIESYEGREPVFTLKTTIEYESIPGVDTVNNVESVMSSIDHVLSNQPSGGVISGLPLSAFNLFCWEEIQSSKQEPGDRRKNIRELKVFAQLTSI